MKATSFAGILAVSVIVLFAMAISAPAVGASTDVNVQWDNAQQVNILFTAGNDAWASVTGGGSLLSGTFTGSDHDDNPYSYNVDTVDSSMRASIVGGGWIDYQMLRTDAKVSMYGGAGQWTDSFIGTDGTASLAFRTTTNYAAMRSSNYGFQASSQFQASGNYYMTHQIQDNDGDGAYWEISGSGSSTVNNMSDEVGYNGNFKLGKGCGCYTNASVSATGSGTYDLYAQGNHSIVTDSGINMPSGGVYNLIAYFTDGFNFSNFALQGS